MNSMIDYTLWKVYTTNISVIISAIPILVFIWSVIGALFYKRIRIIGIVVMIIAVAAILYITVLSRSESSEGADFIPFSAIERAKNEPELYRSMLMNAFLFVPLGLSLPFVFGGSIAKRIMLTILVGFLLSVTVESIQFFAFLGMTETDDVICNTLGTLIGSCAYLLAMLWKKAFMKKKLN